MDKANAKRQLSSSSLSPLRSLVDEIFNQYLSNTNGEISQLVDGSLDVAETDQAFEVKVDLPGIDPEQVDIQIDNNTLTIRGQRSEESEEKGEKKQFHRVERYQRNFSRSVVLPNAINEERTVAEFSDGVLKILIPKSEDAKPRKITISK